MSLKLSIRVFCHWLIILQWNAAVSAKWDSMKSHQDLWAWVSATKWCEILQLKHLSGQNRWQGSVLYPCLFTPHWGYQSWQASLAQCDTMRPSLCASMIYTCRYPFSLLPSPHPWRLLSPDSAFWKMWIAKLGSCVNACLQDTVFLSFGNYVWFNEKKCSSCSVPLSYG